jgi:CBS domain containing-hemolysin-like protein
METIAGNLPNEAEEIDARYDIHKNSDGSWTVKRPYAAGRFSSVRVSPAG